MQAAPDIVEVQFPFLCLSLFAEVAGQTGVRACATLKRMTTRSFLMLAPAAVLALGAHAMELAPAGFFVQGGVAERATYTVTAGVVWPWSWRREIGNSGELTGITEGFVSHWSARGADDRQSLTQIGVLPMLRYRGERGRSAWFIEGGIGVSVMDRIYATPDKQFSTRFNFVDVIGVGRSFGPQQRREVSLRISHVSNAGIKNPNPGENLLQLRYAAMF